MTQNSKLEMDPIEINPSRTFHVLTVVLAIFTFGIGFLLMWKMAADWPQQLDEDGVTRRSGDRFRWEDLTDVVAVRVTEPRPGERTLAQLNLVFGDHKVPVVPRYIDPAHDVLAFLQRKLGDRMPTVR